MGSRSWNKVKRRMMKSLNETGSSSNTLVSADVAMSDKNLGRIDPYNFKIDYRQVGHREDVQDWLYSYVSHNLMNSGKVGYKFDAEGLTEVNRQEFVKHIASMVDVQFRFVTIKGKANAHTSYVGTNADKTVYLYAEHWTKDNEANVSVSLVAGDISVIQKIEEYCRDNLSRAKENSVFVIANSAAGLTLHNLGAMESTLERGNYTNEVVESYDYIVQEFNKREPYGRLAIINGPPGTGKTYLIRSLVSSIKNCIVVLLPSKLVSEIDSPQLITMLSEEKADYGTLSGHEKASSAPILFVVEDADACLLPREGDNIMTISSLLNYTDGILGSMLDLRVVATTNAERIEFDEALTRPGRMCRHVHVGSLEPAKASEVYERLTGSKKEYKKKTTLAEVYADANGNFKQLEAKKSVGFGL